MLQDNNMLWDILKLMLALPVVILLAYISLRLTNKYLSKHNKGKSIQVLERTSINNKASLCVIKIGEELMVIGVNENSFHVIKTLNQDEVKDFNKNKNVNISKAFNINLKTIYKGKSKHE